jgi:hypothetical protein
MIGYKYFFRDWSEDRDDGKIEGGLVVRKTDDGGWIAKAAQGRRTPY